MPTGHPANIFKPIDIVRDNTDDHIPDASTRIISRNKNSILNAVRPILLQSRKVILIDPYFSLRRRVGGEPERIVRDQHKIALLKGMLSIANQGRRVEVFEIYTEHGEQIKPEHINEVKQAAGLKYEIQVRAYRAQQMHDRFLLGNHIGLSIGHGFDPWDDGTQTFTAWLTAQTLNELHNRYTK